jgi:hypothetical protein
MLLVPLMLQAVCILVDEFYFHWKRGLGRWERIGHPVDTLSVIAALSLPVFFSASERTIFWYSVLSGFSCILVTKDEWVHTKECEAAENWLHALLFVLHPLVFVSIGWAWWGGFEALGYGVVGMQWVVMVGFFAYQVGYWGWRRGPFLK